MSLRCAILPIIAASSFTTLFAQQQAPAPPPQTARQALVEMITGGREAAVRHLTIEMQKSLQAHGKNDSSAELAVFDQIKAASSEFQVFESGQILLAMNDPKTHEKLEVHVDSDDLRGDTDNLDISFHQFRDGVEHDTPYTALLSRFTAGFKRQDNVWRLNEVSANIKVPVGDPKLLKGINDNWMQGGIEVDGVSGAKFDTPRDLPIEDTIRIVAFAEGSYATRHPETGFTCTLADLAGLNPSNLDGRIFRGEAHRGYKFSLSACQGKPSESFHLVAEPISASAGMKATVQTPPTTCVPAMTAAVQLACSQENRRAAVQAQKAMLCIGSKAFARMTSFLQIRICFPLLADGRHRPVSWHNLSLIRQGQHLGMQ